MPALIPVFVAPETTDTSDLLALAQHGDPEAFGELCRAWETPLLRQAMVLCGNATAAEDLAQDTLVEAWKSLRRFNHRCQFFTWLCAILVNRHRNALRKRWPIPFSSLGPADDDFYLKALNGTVTVDSEPDRAAEDADRARLLLRCLNALPHKQRQVVYLRYYVDDSLEGIAGAIGCSVGTVKSRLFHALDNLRRMRALRGDSYLSSNATHSL